MSRLKIIRAVVVTALSAEAADMPALWWPVLMAIGIGVYFSLDHEPMIWIGGCVLLSLVTAILIFRNSFVRQMILAAGAVTVGFNAAAFKTLDVNTEMLQRNIGITHIEAIVQHTELRPTGQRLIVRVTSSSTTEASLEGKALRVFFRGSDAIPAIGERVRMRVSIGPVPPPSTPHAYDPQRRAFFEGVSGYGFAIGPYERIGYEITPRAKALIDDVRRNIRTAILAAGKDPPGGVALALIIGERGSIPLDTMDRIRGAGIAHLLAISGLHIGLVAGLFFGASRLLIALIPFVAVRVNAKKVACLAALPPTLAYALIAGFTIPTERAFLMTAMLLVGVIFDRQVITLRSVALAATVILLFRPESLLNPGFQMSFAAVTALVAAYQWWGQRRQTEDTQPRLYLRLRRYVIGLISTSVIAGAATGPFVLYHFQHVATYGVLGNLAAIPLAAFWVMPAGVVLVALMPFGVHDIPLEVMKAGISLMLSGAAWVSDLPGATHNLAAPPTWSVILFTCAGLWICLCSTPLRLLALPFLLLALWGLRQPELPDILVHGSGALIAVHLEDGGLWISDIRRHKYIAERWRQRYGVQNRSQVDLRSSKDFRCDSQACIKRKHDKSASIALSPSVFLEDCHRTDFVAAVVPIRVRCQSPHIDRFDLWKNGTHAIFFGDNKIAVRSVNGVRGSRRWVVSPSKAPQYER